MPSRTHLKWVCFLSTLAIAFIAGCPGADVPDGDDGGSNGDVTQEALSFDGSLSGSALTVSSTEGEAAAEAASVRRQRKRTDSNLDGVLSSEAVAWLEDLEGHRLRDGAGNEYPSFHVNSDGFFVADGLPVGVDLVLVIDADGDGDADMRTFIHIPKDADSSAGRLDDCTADPLSTLVCARIRRLAETYGVKLHEIGISPSALIQRIRDAYENLFGDAGIEDEILMDQVQNLSDEDLAALFEQIIPTIAQRGMQMAEGNLGLAVAADAAAVVKAVCRILVQGGFTVADDPGGVDLSFLGNLPNVRSLSFDEFQDLMGPPGGPPPQFIPEFRVYISTLAEVDRNFANNDEHMQDGPRGGPMFSEHILLRMAEMYLSGKTISLADLHRVVVNLEEGMGARLTYPSFNGPNEPPTMVFEGPDGSGVEIDMEALFQAINELQLFDPRPEVFEQKQAELRALFHTYLGGTAEPTFEALFDGILMDRIGSADEFAQRIRDARAHLPFSRSGPAVFYVIATADAFRDDNAEPVTVDVEHGDDGAVTRVTFNEAGEGKFYVSFGPMTDGGGMLVDLINRRTGRPLHNNTGERQMFYLGDESIFEPVNGENFLEAFSESGNFYPGAPALQVPNPHFDPSQPPDPMTNPPVFEAFVLVDHTGPDATPIRVNYSGGVATFNEAGEYYLLFGPQTHDEGRFELITESGEVLESTPGDPSTRVLVQAGSVVGITIAPEYFRHIYGIDAPNLGYDPSGAPYYDDINDNGVHDSDEPTFSNREFLFNPEDWRSTRVDFYYRRADNNDFPEIGQIDFGADSPQLFGGLELVPRNFKARLNAFRFGRPNVTINLLAAFSPPEFFNGAHSLNADTRVNPFTAIAILNLVFGSVMNVEAVVDFDGPGPAPAHEELMPANYFIAPIGDPVQLILAGFERVAQ